MLRPTIARIATQTADRPAAEASERLVWHILRNRNFAPFFAGNLLSTIGSFFQMVAQSLLIFQLTHASLAVGAISFAQSIGTLVLGPWAGTIADRTDKRRLLIATQLLSMAAAAMVAVATFLGIVSVPWLIAGAVALGLSSTFGQPVTYSLVPALVPPQDLRASLQMYSITFNISRIAGPVLGVLTITSFGYGWAFAANAVSFLFLIGALLIVHPREVARPAIPPRVGDLGRLLTSNRRIGLLLLLVVAMVMTYDPIQTLAPALVDKVFQAPEQWVGYFLGALGASAIAGTLLTKRESSLARVCAFLGLFSLGMAWYALAPVPYLALLGPLIGGAGYLQSNTGAQVLLLREAGEERSGQMMALFLMAFSGVRPLISLLDGALADSVGVRQAGVLMVLPGLAIAVTALVLSGRSRWSARTVP